MTTYTITTNDTQEKGLADNLTELNKAREKQNQLPFTDLTDFLNQQVTDLGNTSYMKMVNRKKAEQAKALQDAAAITDPTAQATAIAAALAMPVA